MVIVLGWRNTFLTEWSLRLPHYLSYSAILYVRYAKCRSSRRSSWSSGDGRAQPLIALAHEPIAPLRIIIHTAKKTSRLTLRRS